ncbi:carboxypeptidase-like protein [Chitinophaga skermanii]|uniref:Carboxypeptidase-like protein n=1 Tax=Chitinophaga skermanii TaxID=331697 RepID=A0A327QQA0_9BACT|nr:DUF5686 family protein [Chitinophaga skermanii]RAJ03957.1 carboxypeptidase-like protein [Chitinophaga skermanii]
MIAWTRIIALIFCIASSISLHAQYKVRGTVKDAHTQELIPFATLQFVGTNTGMVTNAEGSFLFELNYIPSDSLLVRVMGYQRTVLFVDKSLKEQTLDFEISRSDVSLKQFEVKANVNFALLLLRQIIKHKPENNYNKLESYKYELYNKLELDLKNLNTGKLSKNRFTKPFAFILKNIDSTSENKPFLPVFLTETISDYYYQRSPRKTKELIKASRTSGLDNESVIKFLGGMYQNINVYDNYIPVFDKSFVSPISNNGAVFYNYRITDTQYIDKSRFIKLNFEPKRRGENVFVGEVWVQDSTFAVQKMTMAVPNEANINFVRKISLVQEFKQLPNDSSTWFLSKDKFIVDFWTPSPKPTKTIDFIGRKTTTYENITVNDTAATNIFGDKRYPQNITLLQGARNLDENAWSAMRHEELSKNEVGIYKMVDTLQKMPLFQKYSNTIRFLATGYKPLGPIEWGPYWYLFSQNRLEGFRARIDLGTTPQFHKDLYLNGYLAYGFTDQRFKGKLSALYLLNRHPRMYLYGSYVKDLDNGASYYDEVGTDNIFTLAIRKGGVPQKFMMVEEKRFEFFKEYYSGFSHHVALTNKIYRPFAPLPGVLNYPTDGSTDPLNNTDVTIKLRFAYQEEFLEGNYYRISMGSRYPIVELKYSKGFKGILNSSYDYNKLAFTVSDDVKIAPFGSIYYNVFGGKVFGTLPYMLLEVHPGNEIYYYNKYAFNMMNRFEFISDQYAGINFEHTIGNGIFNYIPFVRKFKLRQFWTAKGLIGGLSAENRQLNLTHGYPFRTLEKSPYLEVGTGVENIFKFIRIDFIWRLKPGPLPVQSDKRFGIFGSFKLQF